MDEQMQESEPRPIELEYRSQYNFRAPDVVKVIGIWCMVFGGLAAAYVLVQVLMVVINPAIFNRLDARRWQNIVGMLVELARFVVGICLLLAGFAAVQLQGERALGLTRALAALVTIDLITAVLNIGLNWPWSPRGVWSFDLMVGVAYWLFRLASQIIPCVILLTLVTRPSIKSAMEQM